jgi:hypothetical protein
LSLLGNSALNRISSTESGASESKYDYSEKNIPVGDYPPEQLETYLLVLKQEHVVYSEQQIASWIEYWSRSGHKAGVFRALEAAYNRGFDIGNYDAVFDLSLALFGKDQAYQWLVRAHFEEAGWEMYFSSNDKTVKRWHMVRKYYPARWYDFLRDTLLQGTRYRTLTLGHSSFVHIVEYCIFMKQPELVKQVMAQMLPSTLELVSPLALPTPEWSLATPK